MPFPARWRRTAWIVVVAGLGACASGANPAAEPTTEQTATTATSPPTTEDEAFQQWQQATRAVCLQYMAQTQALLAQAEALTTIEEVAAFFQGVLPMFEEYTAAFTATEVPPSHAREIERVYDLYEGTMIVTRAATEAASAGDGGRFQTLAVSMQSQGVELDSRLTALGLPECDSDLTND